MNRFFTMLRTELKLSIRGMDMVIFALCMPVVIVVILGIIYGDRPASPGAEFSFLQQSFGAMSTIAVCAGGVMGLPLDSVWFPITVMVVFLFICGGISIKFFKWE